MLKLSYPRLKKILMIIILARVEISGSELAKRLNVSTRTIRSDINELNSDIGGYDLKILNRRGKGYYLNFKNEKN
ncbi:helix-turn-helix domain-containing protein [Companilactobacillus alimentarius]|uniref:helix-turn-helix domain-containing protein n=1 Tax=Companilactobacillus alimentarius TaxID=1602 RepID=UPI00070EE8C0|nr:helix-turn-helix domain-containing protein [Companilactobacillus alimentarius]GEO44777.1 hypothetical protein LAL01_10090 [Companilactobacillus alimentarius]